MEKEISKGVIAKLENGVVSVEADLKVIAVPVIEDIQKKIESGEIDLIKGKPLFNKTEIFKKYTANALSLNKWPMTGS